MDNESITNYEFYHKTIEPSYLDLLFIVDVTGSMVNDIDGIVKSIVDLQTELLDSNLDLEIRIGIVQYRDKVDHFQIKWNDFTTKHVLLNKFLTDIQCSGGEDIEEDIQPALKFALHKLSWDPNAIKLAMLIGDAGPHLDYEDYFSYIDAAREANQRGIKIFTLGATGLKPHGEYVFRQIAALTNGEYIFLTSGETKENSGYDFGKVSHHTGNNFESDQLNTVLINLMNQELAPVSETQWIENL